MARTLTTEQRQLLRSGEVCVNALATFYLDEGVYRFCDEVSGYDLTDGVNTWIGASALAEAAEIRAVKALVAEQVTLEIDGNRMTQHGIDDPAAVLRQIMDYLYAQRRVDYAFGLRAITSKNIQLIIPAYAGKINSIQLVDYEAGFGEEARTHSKLIITLDSLAARYNRATNRIRAHEDQKEIDPTDDFFSFTTDVVLNARSVYWGKAAPFASGNSTGLINGAGYTPRQSTNYV